MLDIQTLQDDFKGDLVTPEQPDYAAAIARWASNAERRAAVVAFVKDNTDVVAAIKFARRNGLDIAVRGGGHNAGGASSTEGGLVIDLSRYMNEVTVDADDKVAYVDGGAIWEMVDRETMAHGLATVAGTVNHTGVGGLTLGGGYGWLSGEHGLAIDNLVQATVVTADGSILTASAEENTDLFFAIRGGGGNFGVVTQFVFKLSPQRRSVYSGEVIFPVARMEEIIERTNTWWNTARGNEGLFVGFITDHSGNPIIWTFLFYNGSESDGRANFKWLLDMGPALDTTKEVNYEKVNSLMNHLFPHGNGRLFHAATFRHIHLPSIQVAHKKLVEIGKQGKLQEPAILYQFNPHGVINSVPQGATAFRRDTVNNTLDVLLSLRWDQSQGDQTEYARSTIQELEDILGEGETELNSHEKLGYSNHDVDASITSNRGQTLGNKAILVFGANYQRLQQIKKRYDPDNVFDKWFPIMPAL